MMISDFTTGFQTLIFLAFIQSSISATFCYLHTCIHALTEKCNIFRITEVKSRYCAIQYSNSICSHRAQADLGHALQNYVFKWSSEVTHQRRWYPRGAASVADRTKVLGIIERYLSIFSRKDSAQRDQKSHRPTCFPPHPSFTGATLNSKIINGVV